MTAAIAFGRAAPADEADIRRLLRENPLGGAWSVALEREPDGFGGPHLPGERQDFIIARDTATGAAVGLCERVVRPAWVGGEQVALPYLGALRVAASHRHRIAVLKGGFAALRDQCEQAGDYPAALTSITADNSPARRVLTAGLKGLPRYVPLGDFSSLAIRPRAASGDSAVAAVTAEELPQLAAFLRTELQRRDCAPVWTAQGLAALAGARFLALREGGRILASIALWDQRASRQAVLADCPRAVRSARPAINLLAPLLRLPRIPARGETIRQGFLSHLAVSEDDPAAMLRMVRAGLALAHRAGLDSAVIGVPADHPWRPAIRAALRTIEYRTSLFGVVWPDAPDAASAIAQIAPQRVFPEIGLL